MAGGRGGWWLGLSSSGSARGLVGWWGRVGRGGERGQWRLVAGGWPGNGEGEVRGQLAQLVPPRDWSPTATVRRHADRFLGMVGRKMSPAAVSPLSLMSL
jgi:hypothetical protein